MKTPKIVNAMEHIDDEMLVNANQKKAKTLQTPMWKRLTAIAAAFVLVFCGVLALTLPGGNRVAATVALDVNPSMEIDVNRKEEVIRVRALNEDAERVLAGMDLEDVDLNVAVNAIIGSMLQQGYLTADSNSILVSINSKDTERAAELQNALATDIENILGEQNIGASVFAQTYEKNQKVEEKAEKNHISVAKANLIDKIIKVGLTDSQGVPYTYETLAGMKVHELKLLLESRHIEPDDLQSSGTAASDSYIGDEKALAIALSHAELSREAVRGLEIELDYERGKMVYSVEFEEGRMEYEYEIDAKTGEIVAAEKEYDD